MNIINLHQFPRILAGAVRTFVADGAWHNWPEFVAFIPSGITHGHSTPSGTLKRMVWYFEERDVVL